MAVPFGAKEKGTRSGQKTCTRDELMQGGHLHRNPSVDTRPLQMVFCRSDPDPNGGIMKRSTTATFLLELPLQVDAAQARHLHAHLEVARTLYNAFQVPLG
jgi:hypothetical protein